MLTLIKNLLLENLGIKLVAILLAVALYLHVYTERPASMLVSFPLEITDLADTLALSGLPPEPVRAELKGTGKQLIRLRLTEPRIKLSLAGVGPGHYERAVVAEDLPLLHDEALEVERLVSPRVVALEIEKKLVRRIPVAVRIAGIPRGGWKWEGAYVTDPATVLVNGPYREVSRLDSVRLHAVRVEGKSDTVKAFAAADSLPLGCAMDPVSVRVAVVLSRAKSSAP
jgi:hypothetical protein